MTIVIAHRGASAAFQENTVEAFTAARAMGADMVELDVRRTADGRLAVHHDARLPDGRALVETPAADLPDWVPDLETALDACDGMGVNVEVKNLPGDPDHDEDLAVATAVARLVGERGLHDRVLVSSFNMRDIDRVRGVDVEVPTAWLLFAVHSVPDAVARAVRHGHRTLHPHVTMVDDVLLDACRRAGLSVNTWTVDDPAVMRRLVDAGLDGIVTNVPDVLRAVVDSAR